MDGRELIIDKISRKLAHYVCRMQIKNSAHLFDMNTYAEDSFQRILNRIYGWNLINANKIKMNMPGIDLADADKKIAVQVTSTNDAAKIRHTIDQIIKNEIYKEFTEIYVLVIKEKKKTYKEAFDTKGLFVFDADKHIIDIYCLMNEIMGMDIKDLLEIDDLIAEELGELPEHKNSNDLIKRYRSDWDKELFLEENGKKLRDVFVLPDYQYSGLLASKAKKKTERRHDLEEELATRWNGTDPDSRMRVVFGDPGCGKSSLISWYVNNMVAGLEHTEVYRFSKMKGIEWDDGYENVLDSILEYMKIPDPEHLRNHTIILDGFDEISMESGNRIALLNAMNKEWCHCKDVYNFQLLVTCRRGSVPREEGTESACSKESETSSIQFPSIDLLPFDEEQIRRYISGYREGDVEARDMISMAALKEVLGIPLILYMTQALDFQVDIDTSVTDIYDYIFHPENGIYNNRFQKKEGTGTAVYDGKKHSVPKEQCIMTDRITREIALEMQKEQCQTISKAKVDQWIKGYIADHVAEKDKLDPDIYSQGLFTITSIKTEQKHADDAEVSFVHKSIYEYFVASEIAKAVIAVMYGGFEKTSVSKLITLIMHAPLDQYIRKYLYELLKKQIVAEEGKTALFSKWENIWKQKILYGMLSDMTDIYDVTFFDRIRKESSCFINLSNLIQMLYKLCGCNELIFKEEADNSLRKSSELADAIAKYLRIQETGGNYSKYFCLEHYELRRIPLAGIHCKYGSFAGSDMTGAELRSTRFEFVDFTDTILYDAKLNDSVFKKCKLAGSDLRNAIQNHSQTKYFKPAEFPETRLNGVLLTEEDKKILNVN